MRRETFCYLGAMTQEPFGVIGMGNGPAEPEAPLTQLLQASLQGDREASDRAYALVYDRLRVMAHQVQGGGATPATIQATALVHEVWIKLARGATEFQNRGHFFGIAAKAMRQVVVDAARSRHACKRGGGRSVTFHSEVASYEDSDLLTLDDSLQKLASLNERHAQVVEMRVFAGLSIADTAGALGISPRTVQTDWSMASAWLRSHLG